MTNSMRFHIAALLGAACLTLAAVRLDRLGPVGDESATFDPESDTTVCVEPPPEVVLIAGRIAAKTRVVDRLVARELDLFEAAAEFRRLDSAPPKVSRLNRSRWRGETDEEKICRQVIYWVRTHGGRHLPPREVTRLLAELEEALDARLGKQGRLELPEPR